jgi:hypothetical protein
MKIDLTRQELDDIISALGYFQDDYPDRKGSVHTRRAMAKIEKKLWKAIKSPSKTATEKEK